MKNNDDWIKIFNIEDFKELSDRMERVLYNNENGFTATMTWSIEQAIDMERTTVTTKNHGTRWQIV